MGVGPKSNTLACRGQGGEAWDHPRAEQPSDLLNLALVGRGPLHGSWKGAPGGSLPDVEDGGCAPVSSPLCPGRVLVTRLWPALLYGPACGERCWEAGALPHTGLVLWGPGPGWLW